MNISHYLSHDLLINFLQHPNGTVKKIRSTSKREPTTIEKMVCGALSGLVAQSLTYPLEIVRRRMQTHGRISSSMSNHLSLSSNKNKIATSAKPILSQQSFNEVNNSITMGKIITRLYTEEGVAGFFKGLTMNWMKGPIAFSISFTTYDIVKTWTTNYFDGNS